MSSAAFRQGRYLRPEDRELTPDVVEAGADKEEKTPKKRVQFNVYDAVAGMQFTQYSGTKLRRIDRANFYRRVCARSITCRYQRVRTQ